MFVPIVPKKSMIMYAHICILKWGVQLSFSICKLLDCTVWLISWILFLRLHMFKCATTKPFPGRPEVELLILSYELSKTSKVKWIKSEAKTNWKTWSLRYLLTSWLNHQLVTSQACRFTPLPGSSQLGHQIPSSLSDDVWEVFIGVNIWAFSFLAAERMGCLSLNLSSLKTIWDRQTNILRWLCATTGE